MPRNRTRRATSETAATRTRSRKRFQNSSNETPSPTLRDVAERAGVSTATVSRVLNRRERMRGDVVQRVEAAVHALGYVPHAAARALASRHTRTVGAVVPTLDNPTFSEGVQGFERALEAAGYTLLIASCDYDSAREMRQVRTLVERGVEAVMLVGGLHAPGLYEFLQARDIPYVNTWVYDPDARAPNCGFDNVEAARHLTGYLLDLGHRRLAMIAGRTRDNDRAATRVEGVRRALAERGLELPEDALLERPYGLRQGREAMRVLLARDERPTAVIAGNDLLAVGALLEAQAEGLSVPRDLSLAGFDDIELAGTVSPALTTVRVPAGEMCAQAARYLTARLAGEPADAATRIEVSLIVRETTGPPPARARSE